MDGVEAHFRVHRWNRPVARLSVIAVVDERVAAAARAMQGALAGAPVSVIPPEWLHVTAVTLGPVDEIAPETYQAWRAVVGAGVAAAAWEPMVLGATRAGRTGVSVGLSGGAEAVTAAGHLARDAASRLGIPVAGPVPVSPHLGLAYVREDRFGQRLPAPSSPPERVSWPVRALLVVHLVQDVDAGIYRWSVVDELPVDTVDHQ
ncbi:hypothetical protein DMC63_37775 [Streptomyces sp. WAC 05977]|nr:hypothetical protein DMC63_37775 [Streptomyces sp. WAC 05977]